MNHVTMLPEELKQLTGYEHPSKQLLILQKRGFIRAYIGRKGLILERAHYEAVCRGISEKPLVKEVNLSMFGVLR